MGYDDQTRAWLIRAVDQRLHDNNPYQYGYIIPIQDQRVIATATGYVAHYSWDIPEADQEILIEHNGIQIVDFGFGKNIEAAKGWKTVVGAFARLLDEIATCVVIQVDMDFMVNALNYFDRHSEHGLGEDWEHIHIRCSEGQFNLNCTGSSAMFSFPLQQGIQMNDLSVTVLGIFLKNALTGFEKDKTVAVRITPNLLAIGNEGDQVAIVMGIASD